MVERLIRSFVGIGLPPEVRMAVADRLAEVGLPGSVVAPEHWHVTLRFLGDVEQVSLERLTATLDEEDLPAPFEVRLGALGAFPNPRRATVTWIDVVDPSGSLGALHGHVEEACDAAGLGVEERPFRAHLTLSRVRPPQDVSRLVRSVLPLDIRVPVDEVVVFESRGEDGGTRYLPLESFPL